jgi:hypothetical protein
LDRLDHEVGGNKLLWNTTIYQPRQLSCQNTWIFIPPVLFDRQPD